METGIATSVAALLSNPDYYVNKPVAVSGRLQATVEYVVLVQSSESISISLAITTNNLLQSDNKAWMRIGGRTLYDYDAVVHGTFGQREGSFVISGITKVCLFDSDKANEIDVGKTPGGHPEPVDV